ncbi:uncharacterized protein [Drosophila takahashii]|uniref:uncharacterized protein n=1 Tax=Drosophila takahashii TaxID=29030 RepID=UPI003898EFB2
MDHGSRILDHESPFNVHRDHHGRIMIKYFMCNFADSLDGLRKVGGLIVKYEFSKKNLGKVDQITTAYEEAIKACTASGATGCLTSTSAFAFAKKRKARKRARYNNKNIL